MSSKKRKKTNFLDLLRYMHLLDAGYLSISVPPMVSIDTIAPFRSNFSDLVKNK